jgi:4-amino-4-deoxy-L-arabinose transferase-like glycosyltransferase
VSLLVTGLAIPLFYVSASDPSLAGCDESFYAQIGRELLSSGDWLGPSFLGEPFFEKPPLLPWVIALSYSVFGIHAWSARLPAILAALGAIILTGWIGKHFLSWRATVLAMGILPLCFLWLEQGRLVGQDVLLTFLELLGTAGLIAGIRRQYFGFWVMGMGLGLGLLLKSGMILLAGGALLPYVIQQRRNWLQVPYFWAGIGLGLSLFLSWFIAATAIYGHQVWDSLLGKLQTLGSAPFHPSNTWSYYFWHIPLHGFPWTSLALIGGIRLALSQSSRILLLWSLPLLLLLELQLYATKTHYYTLQLYPWLALLAGSLLDEVTQQWSGSKSQTHLIAWISYTLSGIGILLLGLTVASIFNLWGIQEYVKAYQWGAVGIGLLFLSLSIVYHHRSRIPSLVWIGTLFLASLVMAGVALSQPQFGNFNPDFAELSRRLDPNCQRDCLSILPSGAIVDIGRSGLADVCQAQAVAFYTPHPGRWIDDRDLLAQNYGSYLWISPVQWQQYGSQLSGLNSLWQEQGWILMERMIP